MHYRSDGLSFIGCYHQQVHPFIDKMANVRFLPDIIILGCTYLYLYIVVESGFAGDLAVHLPSPFVVAALGDTDAETGGGAGTGG